MRFDEFLSEVLYNSEKGYYFRKRIGEDYYTATSFEKLFSWTFGKYFIKLGIENILEIGSGEGHFAREVIEFYRLHKKNINYYVYERAKRGYINDVMHIDSIIQLRNFEGVIFQNEVLDAIEFRRFVFKNGSWYELYVKDMKEFYIQEIEDTEVLEYLPKEVNEGLIYDISIKALELLKSEYEILKRGFIVIVDYGYERREILERFPNGSLTCYYKHRILDNPFENLYEQDITYFIDFTLIKDFLKKLGMTLVVDKSQGEFLIENGVLDIAEFITRNMSEYERFKIFNKLKSLVLDFYNFRVLVFSKDFLV
ncbi:MAG: SAM-dependent methyltransferase [candidate division WOR-3 bacterium]|nr:SAM-dependent methyltransferase [candidate division WOR-3 bacterium]